MKETTKKSIFKKKKTKQDYVLIWDMYTFNKTCII